MYDSAHFGSNLMEKNKTAPIAAGKAVRLSNLEYSWPGEAPFLRIASFEINSGERVFLQGASGSGKSTLLSLIAGIATPSGGTVEVCGRYLDTATGASRDRFRADHLGVIFQMFNLIPYLSLVQNVILPCAFSERRRTAATQAAGSPQQSAIELLSRLGLAEPAQRGQSVGQLSIGQQQRVAAARALIGAPNVIIADEPTSALDAGSRDSFINSLTAACDRTGAALIFVSHDASLGAHFDRRVAMADINMADASRRSP